MKKNNLVKNTILLSVGTILTKGITFIMVPFFSRWLSTEDYGTFDLFCTYVTMLIPVISLSTGEGIFRFGVDEKTDEGKAEHITNGFVILIIGLLAVFAAGMGIWYAKRWEYTFPFVLMLIGELVNKYLQSFLRAIKKLNIYSFCSAVSTLLIFACVTVFVRILDLGLAGIIYGYAFGYLLGDFAIIIWTKHWKYISKNCSLEGMRKLITYSLPLVPNSISWWIINVSDRSIINFFLGAAANGIYAIAYKIPNLATSIFNVFSISWQETASEMVDDAERNQYFNQVYNSMYGLLLSLCGGILSCNFILFGWIFDARYYEGHLYTPILVTSVIFSTLSTFFGGIQISFKETKNNGFTAAIGAIVNISVHLVLVKYIGLYAAAISTIGSTAMVAFLRHYFLRKKVRFHINRMNIVCTAVYMYLALCAFMTIPMEWNVLNFLLACGLFVFIQKSTIKKLAGKLLHKTAR